MIELNFDRRMKAHVQLGEFSDKQISVLGSMVDNALKEIGNQLDKYEVSKSLYGKFYRIMNEVNNGAYNFGLCHMLFSIQENRHICMGLSKTSIYKVLSTIVDYEVNNDNHCSRLGSYRGYEPPVWYEGRIQTLKILEELIASQLVIRRHIKETPNLRDVYSSVLDRIKMLVFSKGLCSLILYYFGHNGPVNPYDIHNTTNVLELIINETFTETRHSPSLGDDIDVPIEQWYSKRIKLLETAIELINTINHSNNVINQ